MAGTYQDFLYALGASESSNRYDFVSGPAGYYQATEPALMAVGYYRWDGTSANDLNNGWTGKDGINSLSDFLNNPAVQDKWVGEWFTYLWNTEFNDLGIKQYIGQSIGGVTITESGLLAGAHLVGAPALADYLRSGGTSGQADPNGTTAATYIAKFAGYDAGPVTGTGGDGFPSSAAANEGSSATVPAETVSVENPVQVLPASQTAAETPAAGNTSVEPPVSSSPPGDTAPEQLPSDATAPTATTEGDPTLPLVQPALRACLRRGFPRPSRRDSWGVGLALRTDTHGEEEAARLRDRPDRHAMGADCAADPRGCTGRASPQGQQPRVGQRHAVLSQGRDGVAAPAA